MVLLGGLRIIKNSIFGHNVKKLYFNTDFIEKLKSKIPPKISNLDFSWPNKSIGFVRFNDDIIDSVYVSVDLNNSPGGTLLKFNYVGGSFKFSYIYILDIEDMNNNWNPNLLRIESRFDSKMNLISKYKYLRNPVMLDDGGRIIVIKFEENGKEVNENYISYNSLIDFSNLFEYIEENKIVTNKQGNMCTYMAKNNGKSVYLRIKDMDQIND